MKLGRTKERELLIYVAIFIMLGTALLGLNSPEFRDPLLIMGGAISLVFFVLHFILAFLKYKGDPYLLPISAFLSGIGFVFIYRLTPTFAERQFWWLVVGVISFLLVILFLKDYRKLARYKYIFMIIGLLALIATVAFGTKVGGATNWITLGNFRFQPAEAVKIFLVLFLAAYLVDKKELLLAKPSMEHFGPLLIMWGMSILFLVSQKDLGTALLFFATFLAMLFIATARLTYIFFGGVLFSLGAFMAYQFYSHVRVRFDIWLNPWADIDGRGYQIAQSLFAIGSGGFLGTGLGLGSPNFIPAVHTDFIFSAIVEEIGLIGGIGVIILYILLVYRGFTIALKAKNDYGQMLAAGLTCLLAIQTFIILAGVTKLLPLTGITLPFISYGGSSLLANFIILGILSSISHSEEEEYEN